MQRCIIDRSSILASDSIAKNFTAIEKQAYKCFADPLTAKKYKQKIAMKSAPLKTSGKSKGTPIILVPAAVQSVIGLYNIKELLINHKFVPSEEYRKKGISKPSMVKLTRDVKKGDGLVSAFEVYDCIDALQHQRDWYFAANILFRDRVAIVFTNGQEWQFKGWKWEKPVDVFAHVVGICVKYSDEPAPGSVSSWNVTQLNVFTFHHRLDGLISLKLPAKFTSSGKLLMPSF